MTVTKEVQWQQKQIHDDPQLLINFIQTRHPKSTVQVELSEDKTGYVSVVSEPTPGPHNGIVTASYFFDITQQRLLKVVIEIEKNQESERLLNELLTMIDSIDEKS